MTAEHYHALYRWFDAHPAARRFVIALDRWLPLVPFVCYPVLLVLRVWRVWPVGWVRPGVTAAMVVPVVGVRG